MVYYFSGTGNSAYVAKTISNLLGTSLKFIPSVSTEREIHDGSDLILVFPVYAWGVPPLIIDFIHKMDLSYFDELKRNQNNVWVIMTCGDEVALAPEMIEKAFDKKEIKITGIWSVIMPNNYVLLPGFDVDPYDVEQKKLEEVPSRILEIATSISSGNKCFDVVRGKFKWIKTKLIYPLFRKWGIIDRKWHPLPDCISCGRCASVCPNKNILMKKQLPSWGKNCCSCLACYHICPVHAVAYGKSTLKKGQYYFPLKMK